MTDITPEPADDEEAVTRIIEDAEGGLAASELDAPAEQLDGLQLPPGS